MDLDVVSSEYVPILAAAGKTSAIQKAVASLIGDVSPSHPSKSNAVNISSPIESGADWLMTLSQAPATSGVTSNVGSTPSITVGTVSSETEPCCGSCSTILTI